MVHPPKVSLLYGPTPLHRLDRLSSRLGADIWIKRDDLSGFMLGGNKLRKLEYLMASVLESGADTVVTAGSLQSNFVRQIGAACRVYRLSCAAAVMSLPYDGPAGRPDYSPPDKGGNVFLDEMLGVELHLAPDGTWDELDEARHRLVQVKEQEGRKVFDVPVGGSTWQGVFGFYQAGAELAAQAPDGGFEVVVTPTSSGSTHAGLAQYFLGSATRVVGIACDPEPDLTGHLAGLAAEMAERTGLPRALQAEEIEYHMDWVGAGYNVPSTEGAAASQLLLDTEGIPLDPVYSAKAFAGLIGLIERRAIRGRICFWHTGGMPALFATH